MGPVKTSDFLEDVDGYAPRANSSGWDLVRFTRTDSSRIPTNMRETPFVDGHYYFQDRVASYAFDLGRFLDFVEGANWVDAIHPHEGAPLDPTVKNLVCKAAGAWGPLGRRLYRVSNPSYDGYPSQLDGLDPRQAFMVKSWRAGSLGYRQDRSPLEPAIDWVLELHALRATLRALDYHKVGGGFAEAFSLAEVDPSLPPGAGWSEDGEAFNPPVGTFVNETQSGSFPALLSLADFAVVKATRDKFAGDLLDRGKTDPEQRLWRACVWRLIEVQVSRYLDTQLIVDIKLDRRWGSHQTEVASFRPRSLAGVAWLSLAHYINGSISLEQCEFCGQRYALTSHQKSRRSKKNESGSVKHANYCPNPRFGKKCYRKWKRKNGSQG